MNLTNYQKKALDIYHNDGHEKAWNYWKLTGHDYGIFLGEIPSNEFITGDELINHIGLTEGVPQHSDTPWLKFILDGEIVIIPMKPIMHSVSWEHIYQCGAVYGTDDVGNNSSGGDRFQDARVTIDGFEFKVTLLKGVNSVPTANENGFDIPLTHNSEWNRLMYPIHQGSGYNSSAYYLTPSTPFNQWATYSDDDFIIDYRAGNGSYSWTQETHGLCDNYRLYRGFYGVTLVYRFTATHTTSNIGWRPALRQIT